MSHGLERAGINIVASVDIWDKAVDSYNSNYDHIAICKDLTKYDPAQIENDFTIRPNSIDLVAGGPPCQGFSMAGRRDKNDPRNSLFMEYVKYLDYFKQRHL